jgi:hypothetical protein
MRLRLLKFEYKTKGAYICGNQRIYPTVKSSTSAKTSQVLLDGGAEDATLTLAAISQLDSEVTLNTIKKIVVCAVCTATRGRFGLDLTANAPYFWRVA